MSEMVGYGTYKGPPSVAGLRDGEGARGRGGMRSSRVENDQPRSAEAQAPGLGHLGERMFSSYGLSLHAGELRKRSGWTQRT